MMILGIQKVYEEDDNNLLAIAKCGDICSICTSLMLDNSNYLDQYPRKVIFPYMSLQLWV